MNVDRRPPRPAARPVCRLLLMLTLVLPAWEPVRAEEEPVANRPQVPGRLLLRQRSRTEAEPGSGRFDEALREMEWEAAETAIIVCDMWDGHYCRLSAQRVDEMAPRMNSVLTAARDRGVMIIHAPSGTMDEYEDTPYRLRMRQARPAEPPVPILGWCHLDPEREPPLPINDAREPCDDPVVGERVRRFSRQHDAIRIVGYDGVSDSGPEIYNYFRQEGIRNVAIMGVHTNMCVMGRPFGIRQMTRLGLNVVLVRDMTDAMYDPREYPWVSHARGTELVVEHIETYWCPSILSEDLTRVLPGSDDPSPDAVDPRAEAAAASPNS